jgi:hypothetical protein
MRVLSGHCISVGNLNISVGRCRCLYMSICGVCFNIRVFSIVERVSNIVICVIYFALCVNVMHLILWVCEFCLVGGRFWGRGVI